MATEKARKLDELRMRLGASGIPAAEIERLLESPMIGEADAKPGYAPIYPATFPAKATA